MPIKPNLNYFMREIEKEVVKRTLKGKLIRNFKHMTTFLILSVLTKYYIPNSVVYQL